MSGTRQPTRSGGPAGVRAKPRQLHTYLSDCRLVVVDVARGAAPGTMRLLVSGLDSSLPTRVVSVATNQAGASRVEAEARYLNELRPLVRPALRETLPEVVERVDVSGVPGVVLTAVAGLGGHAAETIPEAADQTGPVLRWLTMLWSDTSVKPAPVDVGSKAYDALLSRLAGSRRAAPALGAVQRSRSALAGTQTARTVSHGCLCPRHLRVSDGQAVGADDWGSAQFGADPLRDLGAWVVRAAGADIRMVFGGRSSSGRRLRELVALGLGYWGLPSRLWRDVLVLAMAEAAVDGLAEQDTTALDLLTSVSLLANEPTTGRTRT
jgi:hypothetical protein